MSSRAFDVRRPFARADAVAAGIGARQLEGPRFCRIFRGVYIASEVVLTPELRVEASLVPFHASAYASHASAARLHRVPIPVIPDEHVSVFDAAHRRNRHGIRCHLVSSARVTTVNGVRAADCLQMFVELGEILTLVDLVVVGDHLVRRGMVGVSALRAFCEESRHPGARAARIAARYVRERVDSPMETRLRMLIVLAGLPEPEVNITIRDEHGEPIRKYDLLYRVSRTVVEYDGRQHIERERQWEADLERRETIADERHRCIVVIAKGIYQEPARTLTRIHNVLRERGEPGVPATLRDAWRPHFPGRAGAA